MLPKGREVTYYFFLNDERCQKSSADVNIKIMSAGVSADASADTIFFDVSRHFRTF